MSSTVSVLDYISNCKMFCLQDCANLAEAGRVRSSHAANERSTNVPVLTVNRRPGNSTRQLTLSRLLGIVCVAVLVIGSLARVIVHRPSWIAIGLYTFAIPLALLNYTWLLGRAVKDMET